MPFGETIVRHRDESVDDLRSLAGSLRMPTTFGNIDDTKTGSKHLIPICSVKFRHATPLSQNPSIITSIWLYYNLLLASFGMSIKFKQLPNNQINDGCKQSI